MLSWRSKGRVEVVNTASVLEFAAAGEDCGLRTDCCSGCCDQAVVRVEDRRVMRSVKLAGVLANGICSQRPIGIHEETVRTLRFVGVTDPPDLRRILICNRAVRSKEKEDRPWALPGVLDRSVGRRRQYPSAHAPRRARASHTATTAITRIAAQVNPARTVVTRDISPVLRVSLRLLTPHISLTIWPKICPPDVRNTQRRLTSLADLSR